MTPDTVKAKAAQLGDRLAARGIAVKHTRLYDLLAAAYGLSKRHLLATTALAAPFQPSETLVRRYAQRLASHDADRLEAIVAETLLVTIETDAPDDAITVHFNRGMYNVPRTLITDPAGFLDTPDGHRLVEKIALDSYYQRWSDGGSQRGPMDLKQGNKLAVAIMDAYADTEGYPIDALEEAFGEGYSPHEHLHDYGDAGISDFCDALESAANDEGIPMYRDTRDNWNEAIRSAVVDEMPEHDNSSVEDLLGDMDRAEVVFILKRPGHDIEDAMLSSHKPWSQPDEMGITEGLQHALASLGYTVGEFRSMFDNRHETQPHYKATRLPAVKRRRAPIVSKEQLGSLISEACSQYFNIVLYAMVPISDLLKLERGKPLKLTGAHIASYNWASGTFWAENQLDEIVVSPDEGQLYAAARWYSPDQICGFVHSYFYGRVESVD